MRLHTAQDSSGTADAAAIPAPACPRCGYDLSAATFGWSEACPLDGRCSECGLEFGWNEILRPNAMPRRWIEGARGFRETVIAILLLPFVSLAANWLFRKIRLGQEGRPRRLWLCLLLPILLIHGFGVVAVVASLFGAGSRTGPPLSEVGVLGRPGERTGFRQFANLAVALPQAALPFLDEIWLPFCDASGSAFRADPWTGTWRPPAPSPTYVGPAWALWDGPGFYRTTLSYRSRPVRILPALTILVPICSALTFAALPVSRKRAKVKAIHIVRCGAAAIAATTSLLPILAVLALVLERFWFLAYAVPVVTVPAAGLGFLVLWWHRAIRDYLRIPHSFAVAFAIVTVGVLGAPVAMIVLDSALRAIGVA